MLTMLTLLAVVWWTLSGGVFSSWLIGVPAIAAAAWVDSRLRNPAGTRISLSGLVRFVPFFLWHSLRGGIDVALRTLAPRMRIRPGFFSYRTTLQCPAARTFFVNCVSLLPGTLAADLREQWVEVHVLDRSSPVTAELAVLERAVSNLLVKTGDP